MKTQLTIDPFCSRDEQKGRLIEFFREWWGIQPIEISNTTAKLSLSWNKHNCETTWTNDHIIINYSCDRKIHEKEQLKISSAISAALSKPVPDYYLTVKGLKTTLRKKHRRQDSKIGCYIYPYQEDADGSWDLNVECLMIYGCDFEALSEGINAVYPNNQGDLYFDYTSWNEFTHIECAKMIQHWYIDTQLNNEYRSFIQYVIDWLQQRLNGHDNIMIEGNL